MTPKGVEFGEGEVHSRTTQVQTKGAIKLLPHIELVIILGAVGEKNDFTIGW